MGVYKRAVLEIKQTVLDVKIHSLRAAVREYYYEDSLRKQLLDSLNPRDDETTPQDIYEGLSHRYAQVKSALDYRVGRFEMYYKFFKDEEERKR